MMDDRLDLLKNSLFEQEARYGSVRIDRIKISNYKFFYGEFELSFSGKNVLIYGENGSGKSSIFKALEYLAGSDFSSLPSEKNLFADDGDPSIEIDFSNGKQLVIDRDLDKLPEAFSFIRGLSVFKPMLNYKKLLPIHYLPGNHAGIVNIYDFLREVFKNYPIEKDRVLHQISNPVTYFETLKHILNEIILDAANRNLLYFDTDIRIKQFVFNQEFAQDGSFRPVIAIEMDYMEIELVSYHGFLNEARLTALAISLYFAAISKLHGSLKSDCLKLLVLDDLLISLDMGNRLKLLEILKSEFKDFQIFFFTHDKELFELYRNKMIWESFELFLDDSESIPKAVVKKGSSPLEKAKMFYAQKYYDACALMLRKEFEKILKRYLTPREQRDNNYNELELAGLVERSIHKAQGEVQSILRKLNDDRKHILNPLSHDDDRAVFSQEIKTAIADLEKLKSLLK